MKNPADETARHSQSLNSRSVRALLTSKIDPWWGSSARERCLTNIVEKCLEQALNAVDENEHPSVADLLKNAEEDGEVLGTLWRADVVGMLKDFNVVESSSHARNVPRLGRSAGTNQQRSFGVPRSMR